MTKCPYVPPHEFNLDFPHLMLRYRAAEFKRGERGFIDKQLAHTDRNGKLVAPIAPLVNWASRVGNSLTRPLIEAITGIDKRAAVPEFKFRSLEKKLRKLSQPVEVSAPAHGRKVVLYATCFANYNNPDIGLAAQAVLARNGVDCEFVYPSCCGMPKLENGDLKAVAASAEKVSAAMGTWIEKGYDVVALTPSCALMLKFEWPLLLPDKPQVKALAAATYDLSEYVVDIAKKEGLADGMSPLEGGITVHLSCHSRAQNMGAKAAEMLRYIPDTEVSVVERCSGHGGKWGMMKAHFDTALDVGKNAARQIGRHGHAYVVSECPLAGEHLLQTMEDQEVDLRPEHAPNPIQLIASAYGHKTESV